MSGSGYISLHRRIQDHWLWTDTRKKSKLEAWIDLLLCADYKTGVYFASVRALAQRWRWPKTTITRFLAKLQRDYMIQIALDDYCLLQPRQEVEVQARVGHLSGQKSGHLIISNYFEYQKQRDTKWDTKWDVFNKDKTLSYHKELSVHDSEVPPVTPVKPKKEPRIETDPTSINLAKTLRAAIRFILSMNGHEPKVPTDKQLITGPNAWAYIINLMIRREKRDPQEMQTTITWLRTGNLKRDHPFIVESAGALRKKYDRIRFQIGRERGKQAAQRLTCASCDSTYVQHKGQLCGPCSYLIETGQKRPPT